MPTPRLATFIPNLASVGDPPTRLALQITDKRLVSLRDLSVPLAGTLSPDTRPTGLTAADVGFLFHATDFDRLYRWSGAGWEDAPSSPPRGMVAYFLGSAPAGWAACDGRAAEQSTSPGTLAAVSLPSLPPTAEGLRPFYRL